MRSCASRTTSTTAATAGTARAARSRCRAQPLDALPPLDLALRAAMARSRLPDVRRLPRARRHRRQPRGAHRRATAGASRRTTRTSSPRGRGRTSRCGATCSSTGCCSTAGAPSVCAPPRARRSPAGEVIVSAGAIHSPAILLRSGVGIDDGLPVGANLKDHAATAGLRDRARSPPDGCARRRAPVFGSMLRYTSGLAEAGPNDMQILWFDAVGPTDDALAGGRLIGAVMRVFSRGEVRLRSADPHDDPVVEFRMLSDDRDRIAAARLRAPHDRRRAPSRGHGDQRRRARAHDTDRRARYRRRDRRLAARRR